MAGKLNTNKWKQISIDSWKTIRLPWFVNSQIIKSFPLHSSRKCMQYKVKKVSYRRCISIDTFPIQIHCSQIQWKDTKNVSRYVSGRYSIRYSHALLSSLFPLEEMPWWKGLVLSITKWYFQAIQFWCLNHFIIFIYSVNFSAIFLMYFWVQYLNIFFAPLNFSATIMMCFLAFLALLIIFAGISSPLHVVCSKSLLIS